MPDYSKGKIYIIRSYQTDKVYIGSTTQTLAQRIGKHRNNYKDYKNGKYHYVSSFQILQYDDYYIELLKEYPCDCKEKLLKKEGKYIRKYIKKNTCVNMLIAGRTDKQYYQDNKEKIKKRVQQYYQDNDEKIKEYSKQWYQDNKEKCLNLKKEWYQDNREKIKEYQKKYLENNKNKIKKWRSEKIVCSCGGKYTKANKACHERTQKHLKWLESQ